MADNSRQIVRKSTLAEQGKGDDLRYTTAEQRLKMMWQMTVDAYAMMGIDATQPMRKDVVRLSRLKDQ
jgi:hypothetical protein